MTNHDAILDTLRRYGMEVVRATNSGKIQAGMMRGAVDEHLTHLAGPYTKELGDLYRQFSASPQVVRKEEKPKATAAPKTPVGTPTSSKPTQETGDGGTTSQG